jgi:hypothetical protein
MIDSRLTPARRLDVATCAKCSGVRIGEAGNPGPRRPRAPRAVEELEGVQLLEPGTIRIREWIVS